MNIAQFTRLNNRRRRVCVRLLAMLALGAAGLTGCSEPQDYTGVITVTTPSSLEADTLILNTASAPMGYARGYWFKVLRKAGAYRNTGYAFFSASTDSAFGQAETFQLLFHSVAATHDIDSLTITLIDYREKPKTMPLLP